MKKILLILIIGGIVMGLFGCGNETKYKVDYQGQKSLFSGAKDSYCEGDTVKLVYDLIATDTDYSFYVDDKPFNAEWDSAKQGYVIKFKMPDHDISVYCKSVNSMTTMMPME